MADQDERGEVQALAQFARVRDEIADRVAALRVPLGRAVSALIQRHHPIPVGKRLTDWRRRDA